MADKDRGRGILKDVAVYYAQIERPGNKYQSENKEFSVWVAMDKKTSTEFSKQFPNKKITPVDNETFVEKYKTDVPHPEAAVQYVMKLAVDELRKDGTPIPDFARPRAILEGLKGELYDITDSASMVGNGSRGDVHYTYYTTQFGKAVRLSNVVIRELVKYERPVGDYIDVDALKELPKDFDIDAIAIKQTESKQTVSVPRPKAAKKQSVLEDDPEEVTDEELPF